MLSWSGNNAVLVAEYACTVTSSTPYSGTGVRVNTVSQKCQFATLHTATFHSPVLTMMYTHPVVLLGSPTAQFVYIRLVFVVRS